MNAKVRVAAARAARELSQEELAELAGLSARTVRRIEAGEDVHVGSLRRVSRALGLVLGDLTLEGPELLDVSFELDPGARLGPLATLEARVGTALRDRVGGGLSVWPWEGVCSGPEDVVVRPQSRLRVRATSGTALLLLSLGGCRLAVGEGVELGAATAIAVSSSESLRVLVTGTPDRANARVLARATAAGCCPRVELRSRRPFSLGRAWEAVVSGLPGAASSALQRLPLRGSLGLFVPVAPAT